MRKKLMKVLGGEAEAVPPVWLMRQAGRYLPEYRELRQRAGSFLNLCFHPEWAAAVTLQPVVRFDMDAAIIFADILLIPQALGLNLRFEDGEGPQLDPLKASAAIEGKTLSDELDAVYAALRLVRRELPDDKALIGFCGAPFTVACYMVAGGGSKDFGAVRDYIRRDRQDFIRLLTLLADYSASYLCEQIAAGADLLQIFESWAGLIAAEDWDEFALAPVRRISDAVHAVYPNVPIIGFPRGAGAHYPGYAVKSGVQGLGIDQIVPVALMAALQDETVVQGNLAPEILVKGGADLAQAVREIKQTCNGKPYIFNLGHGVLPQTPPEHVAELVRLVRAT